MHVRLLASFTALAFSLAAHADTVVVFDLDASFASTGSAFGTITIDTTSGQITGSDFNVTSAGQPYSFDPSNFSQSSTAGDTLLDFTNGSGDMAVFSLPVSTLVGYSGGAICPPCTPAEPASYFQPNAGPQHFFFNGTLTGAATVVTPEPSTLALLGTGALGLASAVRRRRR